jgi:hypothetical protein
VSGNTGIASAHPLHVSRDTRTCKFAHPGNLKPAKDNSTERIDCFVA